MTTDLLEKLVEADFADLFKPADKEELIGKRGWALFNTERSEVKLLATFEEALEYAAIGEDSYKSYYRQGYNFYGVRDKQSKAKFLVLVGLDKKLRVLDKEGQQVKYFME